MFQGVFGWRGGKVGGQKIVRGWKIFSFPSYVFGWRGEKVGEQKTLLFDWREKQKDGKCNLYKLTIISLIHNIYKKIDVFVLIK